MYHRVCVILSVLHCQHAPVCNTVLSCTTESVPTRLRYTANTPLSVFQCCHVPLSLCHLVCGTLLTVFPCGHAPPVSSYLWYTANITPVCIAVLSCTSEYVTLSVVHCQHAPVCIPVRSCASECVTLSVVHCQHSPICIPVLSCTSESVSPCLWYTANMPLSVFQCCHVPQSLFHPI